MKHKLRKWSVMLLAAAMVAAVSVGCGGEDGLDGVDGEDGADGVDGVDGQDGLTSLVEVEEVPPGDTCEYGGVVIHTGVDENGDGELSEDEITHSETLCAPSPADGDGVTCEEPFEVTEISGADQSFFEGNESDPLQLEANADEHISMSALGEGAEFDADDDGSFTVTPDEVGGPLEFKLIAAHPCGTVVLDFELEEVEPNEATIQFVNLLEEDVSFFKQGADDALADAGALSVSDPVAVDPDYYEFDLLDSNDDPAADSTPDSQYEIGNAYTVIAYDDDGDDEFLILEDDLTQDITDDHVALRAVNTSDVDIDVAVEDDEDNTLASFDDVAPGDYSGYEEAETGIAEVMVEDDDGSFSIGISDDFLTDGDVVNLIYLVVQDLPHLLIQRAGEAPASYELLANLEDALGDDFDGTITTGGDADWFLSTEEVSTGTYSLQAGPITHSEITWMDVEVEFEDPGELTFDWFASNEGGWDELLFCEDPGDCDLSNHTDTLSGETGWESYSHTVDDAGTHTFRFAYAKDGSVSQNRDTGWVDNIEVVD